MNGRETVMVEDGANCTLVVRKSKINSDSTMRMISKVDPIWIVDYSTYHGKNILTENDRIEILGQLSSQNGTKTFGRIPECYFQKLTEHINPTSIYTGSEPSNKAIKWLMQEDNPIFKCEDDNFEERFALAVLISNSDVPDEMFVKNDSQCTWQMVTCSGGVVSKLNVASKGLDSVIPTELSILSALRSIKMGEDTFEAFL